MIDNTKSCGESCGCAEQKSAKKPEEKKPEQKLEEKKSELDPTHFGDWQVNCRAIDF